MFSAVAQSEKFDAAGCYIRRWLPELAAVPPPLLFQPWRDAALLQRTGYPPPLLDLAASRAQALAAYQQLRAEAAR